jgi:hypothetical protein
MIARGMGRPSKAVVVAVAVLGALSLGAIYAHGAQSGAGLPIRSDGYGYYLYLPAVFVDHDLTMRRTYARVSHVPPWPELGIAPAPAPHQNRWLDQYPIGEAVMIGPFFAAGEVVAVVTGASRDGFSWPYQAAVVVSGLFYAVVGLVLVASVLRRFFRERTVALTLLAITFGTDLFHYATYDAAFSHAFSFCVIALAIRLALSLWDRPRPACAIAFGAAVGLIAIVRPTNLAVLVFCALLGVQGRADLVRRVAALRRHAALVGLGAATAAVFYIPQILYWYRITGRLFVDPYQHTGRLMLLHPHVLDVLFSVRKGLFFWAPILLFAVVGLWFLRRAAPGLVVPAVAYLVAETWVVSSWSIWWYGGSFGMRPFVDAMCVFALGLAALLDLRRSRAAGYALATGLSACVLLSLHGMFAYWSHSIPYDHTTLSVYLRSF